MSKNYRLKRLSEKEILQILEEPTSDPEPIWEDSESDADPGVEVIAEDTDIEEQPLRDPMGLIIPESDSDDSAAVMMMCLYLLLLIIAGVKFIVVASNVQISMSMLV